MVVPHRLCGGIIGRGGATIHSFMDDSGAQLSVSPHNDATGFGERIIYITGAREAQLRAVALVATKMCEDRRYRTDEVPLSYPSEGILYATSHAGLPFMAAAAAPCHPAGQHLGDTGQGAHDGSSSSSGSEWALEMRARFLLPEEAIGVVIGKQGRTIQSIRHRSGARIKVSRHTEEGMGQAK